MMKKILMISTDRKAFEPNSDVRRRFEKYGELVEELHIIIFAKKNLGFKKERISKNVFLYPTNSSKKFRYFSDAAKISDSIKSFNLITTQDPFETGIVGMRLARKFGVRIEVQLHTDFLDSHFKKENIKNRFRIPLGKKILYKADCIRVVSERIKKSIMKNMPDLKTKPSVFPIFVDTKSIMNTPVSVNLKEKYPQFNFITLMASRLEKEKNIHIAIKAFKGIITRYPKVGLVIVGSGSRERSLKLLVVKYSLQSNIVFEKWQDDLPPYKAANLFLNTSSYEGYGRTIVESLAAGTPVLSTDVGVAREAGADIFITDEELTAKLEEYIGGKEGGRTLLGYPYENESAYLSALKSAWETCGKK